MKCIMSFSCGLVYICREIYFGKRLANTFSTSYNFNIMFIIKRGLVNVNVYILLRMFLFRTKLLYVVMFS